MTDTHHRIASHPSNSSVMHRYRKALHTILTAETEEPRAQTADLALAAIQAAIPLTTLSDHHAKVLAETTAPGPFAANHRSVADQFWLDFQTAYKQASYTRRGQMSCLQPFDSGGMTSGAQSRITTTAVAQDGPDHHTKLGSNPMDLHDSKLQAVLDQLRQTQKEQAEFSYAISHDLKSPTNTMMMLIDELRIGQAMRMDEDGRELLDLLEQTSTRMRQIVDDMLTYSRCNETHETHGPVDLNEVLDEAVATLGLDIDRGGATLSFPKFPIVSGNRMQLATLFQHLIGNAVKFRHAERLPEVTLKLDEVFSNRLIFSVHDNGIGIAPQFLDRIFGLFQRLHGYEVYKGSGVGLALCKRIAANHGGQIRVASMPGSGSSFTISLKRYI